jgi:hypothetical protein
VDREEVGGGTGGAAGRRRAEGCKWVLGGARGVGAEEEVVHDEVESKRRRRRRRSQPMRKTKTPIAHLHDRSQDNLTQFTLPTSNPY